MPGTHEPLTESLLDGAFPAADPFPLFARLRTEAPVAWREGPGFWAVSRMAEVLEVAGDPVTYCSSRGILVSEIGTVYDAPPTMIDAMRGPMMYPTPNSAGDISAAIDPALNGAEKIFSGVSFHALNAPIAV